MSDEPDASGETRGRGRRLEFTLPAGLDRFGVRSGKLAAAGAVVTAVLVATAAVALGVTGDDPTSRAKPAASERDDARTPVGDLLAGGNYPQPALSGDTGTVGVPTQSSPRPTAPVIGSGAVSDVGRTATYRGGAGTLTPAGIATLAMAAGCSPGAATIATAVAMAESGGSPSAQGDTTLMDSTWDWSAGLWQIRGLRSQRSSGALRDSIANQDPARNAAAMYEISGGCRSWGPWTTYTCGTYRSFLGLAEQAVSSVEKYRAGHGGKLPPVAPVDPDAPIPAGGGAGGGTGGSDAVVGAPGGAAPASGQRTPAKSASRSTSTATPSRAPSTGSSSGAAGGSSKNGSPSGSHSSGTAKVKLPTKLPTTLPVKLPTKLPTTLPVKLPTKLPSKLPVKLPTKLPTLLPGL